jgi:hypothetical protein
MRRAVLNLARWLGPWWLRRAGGLYRKDARPLSEAERAWLGVFFTRELLDRVVIAEPERILVPGERLASRLFAGKDGGSRGSPRAITLVDVLVIERACAGSPDARSVLFHELVHVAQFERLGVRRFVREYVSGWAMAGRFDSFAIPLEVEAYALQARYEAGEMFEVEPEIRRRWPRDTV